MFKHEFNLESIMTKDIIEDILTVDEPSENEETIEHDIDNVNFNSTFTNPSQADKILNEVMFKCEKCDFAFARKNENLQNNIQRQHKKKKKYADRTLNLGEAPR